MPATQMYKLRLGAHRRWQNQQAAGPEFTLSAFTHRVCKSPRTGRSLMLPPKATAAWIITVNNQHAANVFKDFLINEHRKEDAPESLTVSHFHVKY